ncbi:hypothetical protein [Lysinibacillus sp. fls2-241-R2A-57]|uniref:hypothetical protein n=1 Tax=Lysinibacillus sp. fls2-241-R2A-57 TaxID=3040292 RepID=UPI0025529425|nr:hypothetical protein [Lysinibacillus sp. fls2-241-R2A-57]
MTKKVLITNLVLMMINLLSMFWNYFQASAVYKMFTNDVGLKVIDFNLITIKFTGIDDSVQSIYNFPVFILGLIMIVNICFFIVSKHKTTESPLEI